MAAAQPRLLEDPIDVEFRAFHHAHPEVYAAIVELAREWKAAGHDRCSMNMLFEVLRYRDGLNPDRDGGFKLNNNYRSRYSRIVMANEPDLDGLFEVRQIDGDDPWWDDRPLDDDGRARTW